jgi:hypothetical protein
MLRKLPLTEIYSINPYKIDKVFGQKSFPWKLQFHYCQGYMPKPSLVYLSSTEHNVLSSVELHAPKYNDWNNKP